MKRPSGQTLFLGSVVIASIFTVGYVVLFYAEPANGKATTSKLQLEDIPFGGDRAYEYLQQLCAIGPRPSGSPGMEAQQKLIGDHFKALGAEVELQSFQVRHPLDGSPVTMRNLIARWHPDRKERILLCAHYDTRPYPDRDPRNPRGTFIGANDGASGVAVLMELAHDVKHLPAKAGVDFVLFDGEELVYQEGDPYFLGSQYFASDYAGNPPGHRYRWGVLLDMVGDRELQLFHEVNSVTWKDTRPLVKEIWDTAARLKVREFIPRAKHEVRDDHIMLRNIGKIPTCVIIDFDYPRPSRNASRGYWHTEADTPDKCSALSLAKVGWVVSEWLKTQ